MFSFNGTGRPKSCNRIGLAAESLVLARLACFNRLIGTRLAYQFSLFKIGDWFESTGFGLSL